MNAFVFHTRTMVVTTPSAKQLFDYGNKRTVMPFLNRWLVVCVQPRCDEARAKAGDGDCGHLQSDCILANLLAVRYHQVR